MFSALFRPAILRATTSLWPTLLMIRFHEVLEQLFPGICDRSHANLEIFEPDQFSDNHFCAIVID